jgi:E3 ubiquitin-protein ligase HECW2
MADRILQYSPVIGNNGSLTSTSSTDSTSSSQSSAPTQTRKNDKSETFLPKLQQLQSVLDVNGYAKYGEQNLNVRRTHLLQDAYEFLMGKQAKSLRVKKCNVSWDEEEGLDYGGPQREFFFKLSRLVFNPYYGLFEYTSHGAYTVQISQYSAHIDDAHLWFRFVGRLIGYSIIQNQLLDVFFARHVYKSLLNIPFTVNDVEDLDISFYNSLKYVLENDPAPLELNFTVQEESFGEIVDRELKPDGAIIQVDESNKKEYVDLMVQWKLQHGVHTQTSNLLNGLKEMIPIEYLKPFDAQELEWVIAGTPEINLEDWKCNTVYRGGYHNHHCVIKWFWEAIESFTDEQKLRFLQFATGTSSIPYEGFKALRGSSQQITKFTIDRYGGSSDSLPIAHTCFNRVDLPHYSSLQEMKEKLLYAITETDTFETA